LGTGIVNPVLILENCRIHHNVDTKALLLSNAIDYIYLPPYSPEFNPIEEAFSKVKAFIRRNGRFFYDSGFNAYFLLDQAFASISAQDSRGWIDHAGYVP